MQRLVKCRYPYNPPAGKEGKGQLKLERGDILAVGETVSDSKWVHGKRLRDGAQGWLPKNYCRELGQAELEQALRELNITAAAEEEPNTKRLDGNLENVSTTGAADASAVSEEGADPATLWKQPINLSAKARSAPEHPAGTGEQYWRYRCADLETELDTLRERFERFRQEMTEALTLEMQRREYAESKLQELCDRLEAASVSDVQAADASSQMRRESSGASPHGGRSRGSDPLASPELVSKLSVRERQRLFMEKITSMHQRRY